MEILSRTFLPIVPIQPDELARKADLGAVYSVTEPVNKHVGMLWATDAASGTEVDLFMWDGTAWLPIAGGGTPPPPTTADWDSGATWDGGSTWA